MRVEGGEGVALLHRRADIDQARQQLAGDPERQVALIARLNLADRLAAVEDRFGSTTMVRTGRTSTCAISGLQPARAKTKARRRDQDRMMMLRR